MSFFGENSSTTPKINGDSMKADQLMSGSRMNKGVEARRQASMIKDYCGASGERW